MGHGIEIEDIIFSEKDGEWHGLAHPRRVIEASDLYWVELPIVESELVMQLDGAPYKFEGAKIIAADFRRRVPADEYGFNSEGIFIPEEFRMLRQNGVKPLHTPRTGYKVIPNADIIAAAFTALKNLGMRISSVGTLEGGKKFFMSCTVEGDEGLNHIEITSNGVKERTLAYINFITSHDGSIEVEAYDSMIRIVCMNTLQWSRNAAGQVGLKVAHTKNAQFNLERLSEYLNLIFTGRAEYKTKMEMLASRTYNGADVLNWVSGYFAHKNNMASRDGNPDMLITKTQANRAEKIADLAMTGKGNAGRNWYDAANGITDFFTNGDGAGSVTVKPEKRRFRANRGEAAEYKVEMLEMLVSDFGTVGGLEERVKVGANAYALAV